MRIPLVPCVAALAVAATLQPYRPVVVSGGSMAPTYHSGQLLIGDSRTKTVQRGDVVIFRHDGQTFVKRVVLIGGDHVERYRAFGEEHLANSEVSLRAFRKLGRRISDFVVPEGTVYVLGDNYVQSVDSRTYGPIPAQDIIAVVDGAKEEVDDLFAGVHHGPQLVATR